MKNCDDKPQEQFNLAEFKKKYGFDKVDKRLQQSEAEWKKKFQTELFKSRMIENYVFDLTKLYGMD